MPDWRLRRTGIFKLEGFLPLHLVILLTQPGWEAWLRRLKKAIKKRWLIMRIAAGLKAGWDAEFMFRDMLFVRL